MSVRMPILRFIRKAISADADGVAGLLTQLGYSHTGEFVRCHSRRALAHEFYQRRGFEESPKYLMKRL